ncbi:hypothetical protein RQP46_011510 [Phenoliferia psychrophenolica]
MTRTPGVKMTLVNQTGAPLQVAAWPVAADDDGDVCPLQAWKGAGIVDRTVPEPWRTYAHDAVVDLGLVRLPEKDGLRNAHSYGWIFFDVLRPPPANSMTARPYRIHGQAFLRLSTSGNEPKTGLGRFDLDSSKDKPTPSGSFGRVEFVYRDSEPGAASHFFGRHHRRASSADSRESHEEEGESGEVVEVKYILTSDVIEVVNDVDDGTKSGNIWLPTKNLSVSSWVSCDAARIELLINKEARYHEHHALSIHPKELRTTHHALDGMSSKTCFMMVSHEGERIFDRWVKINPALGAATGPRLVSTRLSTVIFDQTREMTINVGFFDAGVTRAKELYIYASHCKKTWLGDLIAENPLIRQVPFSQLALAGAHDAGMLGDIDSRLLQFIKDGDVHDDVGVIAKALPFVQTLLSVLKTFNFRTARILENMANTQKDSIPDQLAMGVRFFDFRPGYCLYDSVSGLQGELHHQHAIVPGEPYLMFLIHVLNFLGENPSEIVFFEIKSDGFAILTSSIDPATGKPRVITMVPTLEELEATFQRARTSAGSEAARAVVVGSPEDLERPIGELLNENRRLIIADRVHFPDAWPRADSYSHEAYDTDDPQKVMAALKTTYDAAASRAAKKEGPAATIYQLQATPTAQIWADVGASLSYSEASSLLVWSKCRMDRVTYSWIAGLTFIDAGNVIFLNDFVDGALVEHAVEKTKERCTIWLAKRGLDK